MIPGHENTNTSTICTATCWLFSVNDGCIQLSDFLKNEKHFISKIYFKMGQWFSTANATIKTVAKFEGEDVKIATLKNANGMEVEIINFGCVLRSVTLSK